ncbi:hypothetical protein KAR91_23145 [Candidatus Pacearchaeota archaeon]|nr:hypothetical protein [Candidatus Pacearchaeota archaeon]
MKEISGRALFEGMFKIGEEVVAIDDEDRFFWGKLQSYDECGFTLSKGKGIASVKLDWEETQFMAHDGFPVQKLLGADGSEKIVLEDTKDIQGIVRRVLDGKICEGCFNIVKETCRAERAEDDEYDILEICAACIDSGKYHKFVIRHPYLIEDVQSTLFNVANLGLSEQEAFYLDREEVVLMGARNGAGGLLWDIPSIYYFE